MPKFEASIKMNGDWDKIRMLTNQQTNAIKESNKKALIKVGLKAERVATLFLRNQSLGWPALKKETLKEKIKRGGSEKILIDTSTYLQSITSKLVSDSKVFAGVLRKNKVKYKNSQDVVNVAIIHEFGSKVRNIPPRPLWRPTFVQVKTWILKSKVFENELNNHFYKKFM